MPQVATISADEVRDRLRELFEGGKLLHNSLLLVELRHKLKGGDLDIRGQLALM